MTLALSEKTLQVASKNLDPNSQFPNLWKRSPFRNDVYNHLRKLVVFEIRHKMYVFLVFSFPCATFVTSKGRLFAQKQHY